MGKNALVVCLCGVLGRKKSPPPPPPSDEDTAKEDEASQPSSAKESEELGRDGNNNSEDEQPTLLPPPPGGKLTTRTVSYNHDRGRLIKSKLASSMSMKMPGNVHGAVGKQLTKLEEKAAKLEEKAAGIRDKKLNLKQEESVWKKQIILGERNKVQDNVEEDDKVLKDEMGNKSPTYTQRSNSITSTFAKPEFDHQHHDFSKK